MSDKVEDKYGDRFEVLEKIGHGSFGVIRKVRRKQDGQILCRKEINYTKMSQKEKEQLHAEFIILASLRHPNIVGYYHREHIKTTYDLHLYMEYCGNGDLGRVIKQLQLKKEYAEEGFVWSMFAQLVGALYRCHYGVDAPETGSNVMGLGNSAKPRAPANGTMILHRDLKPENIFLGEDNSVKLGDFGLSKMMASHDFASTYVGTPFYMSPEICAAERYTLKSDIWSLGCIIYELCAREPPFNAKSHFQLVQKIKEGKVAPLPAVYSPELNNVIRDCLRVNPERRPDTAQLINIPMVKLMRKEKEVVDSARELKKKHALADQKQQELDQRLQFSDSEKFNLRQEIDASVRREWEVKAKLEISRLVQLEIEQLRSKFDEEVNSKVRAEMQKRSTTPDLKAARLPNVAPIPEQASTLSDSEPSVGNSSSSIGSNGESEFGSSTDLTDISTDSPETIQPKKRSTRTPLARAQTIGGFMGTPMDVEMGEPSPIAIASLSLSPRRGEATRAPTATRNIFAAAAGQEPRMQPILMNSDSEDDDVPTLPSPTRPKSSKNPFKPVNRPALISQKTAPVNKQGFSSIFNGGKPHTGGLPTLSSAPDLRPSASNSSLKDRSPSPNRRISKIPSSTNLSSHDNPPTSPTRKSSLSKKTSGAEDLNKLAMKNNMTKAVIGGPHAPKGRTLVELAQARAGGRPIGDGNRSPEPKGRAFAQRMADKVASRDQEPAVWDPEREEMPSPFLSRTKDFKRF